jgi:hypothetical protein
MMSSMNQLLTTLEQMERLLRALDDLKLNVLPKDPALFAVMAEAPLDDLARLKSEIHGYAHELQATA